MWSKSHLTLPHPTPPQRWTSVGPPHCGIMSTSPPALLTLSPLMFLTRDGAVIPRANSLVPCPNFQFSICLMSLQTKPIKFSLNLPSPDLSYYWKIGFEFFENKYENMLPKGIIVKRYIFMYLFFNCKIITAWNFCKF